MIASAALLVALFVKYKSCIQILANQPKKSLPQKQIYNY